MDSEKETSKVKAPSSNKWLQRLKEESWEAELLVSTVAIYGTFKMFDFIELATNFFINILHPDQYLVGYSIVFLGLLAVGILMSMFLIHFFLRAYWVGLVGLNSVFPDYSIENSAYSEIYTRNFLAILPKLKNSIQKVDDLCSVIFSAAFTLMLIYMYMSFSSAIYLMLYNLLEDYVPYYILLIPLVILGLLLVTQMITSIIANLKRFKNHRPLQLFSFRLSKLVSMLSYGPFYKPILQVSMIFGSNFKRNKTLTYLILVFVLGGMLVSSIQIGATNIPYLIDYRGSFQEKSGYSAYYKNANLESDFILSPEIENDIIKSQVTKLFIPIFTYERNYRKAICGEPKDDGEMSRSERRLASRSFHLDCYQKYVHVFLNGELLPTEFLRSEHQITEQRGLTCFLDLSHASSGINYLDVIKYFESDTLMEYNIPFYFDQSLTKEKL